MEYMDVVLTCWKCGASFTFRASERKLLAVWDSGHGPKHCPDCRAVRNEWRPGLTLAGALQALIQSSE
jgi:hypothetical protein